MKLIGQIMMSIVLGFILNFVITIDLITRVFGGNQQSYVVIAYLALIGQISVIFMLLRLIMNKKIDTVMLVGMGILYFGVLVVLLFGRQSIEATVNFNLASIFDFSPANIVYNLFNYVFFIPLGYLVLLFASKRRWSQLSIISGVILFIVGIEVLQLLSLRGIFDIVDIILNTIGVMSGYYLSQRFELKRFIQQKRA